ncbi:uncharacterized protein LOC119691915 [Plutella xylostella]|uniref:uncharacterized protein LOC119691915 n=1 Tax=Plutella xylostella TaxID=51655 RepID=UPI00203279E9|nr:uncharacterized protein LOC119691915 [Plutella xylostella]
MTLLECLLKKVHYDQSHPHHSKVLSPPPEMTKIEAACRKAKLKNKYASVKPRVDNSAPRYYFTGHVSLTRQWLRWGQLMEENLRILAAIRRAGAEGKVDSHWRHPLPRVMQYYKTRCDFVKQNEVNKRKLYKLLSGTKCRVQPTRAHNEDWKRNRREIIRKSQNKFILFPENPRETFEDPSFRPSEGFRRPR